jgi:hypothetical protein
MGLDYRPFEEVFTAPFEGLKMALSPSGLRNQKALHANRTGEQG